MKTNKLIITLIIAANIASHTFALTRLTGRGISDAVTNLKKQIPQGAQVTTPEEYSKWHSNVVKFMAQLEISKPITLTSEAYSKPPLTDLFKQYNDEAYNRVIKRAVNVQTPQEAEKEIEIVKEVLQEAQTVTTEVAKEIGKKVTWADEVGQQLEHVIELEDQVKDLRDLLPDVEKLIVGEEKEEEQAEEKAVEQEEKEVGGFWQQVTSAITGFFQKDPKLQQLDVLLEDNLKGKVSAQLDAEIKKQANTSAFVQINDYYTNLQNIENELDSYIKKNFEGKEQENKLKTIQDKIKFQYTNLARQQMKYANLIVYQYAQDIKKLANDITAPLRYDNKEYRSSVPSNLQQFIPKSLSFSNAINTVKTIDAVSETEKSAAYTFMIQTAIQELKVKTTKLSSYLGIQQQAGDKYVYADMKNAISILNKTGQLSDGQLKSSVYTGRELTNNFEEARSNLRTYFTTSVEKVVSKDSTLKWILEDLRKIDNILVDTINKLNTYLPANVKIKGVAN